MNSRTGGKYVRPRKRTRRGKRLPMVLPIITLLLVSIPIFANQPAAQVAGLVREPPAATTEPTIPTERPTEPEDYIDAAADALLETLLPEEATAEEQVRAIYRWARSSLSYGGHSDRTDWRQTAYTMLTEYRGDCYGYFAVTKLLFQRLDIPNIDVQKVRNYEDDSDHFWSLVSVDGGETWYHFDATPRIGDGDDFCLVTDAFLDAYSETHKNSHNRDKSLYPATPEEAL